MPALQRGAACAEERLSGALPQSVTQNGGVHLHVAGPNLIWCSEVDAGEANADRPLPYWLARQ